MKIGKDFSVRQKRILLLLLIFVFVSGGIAFFLDGLQEEAYFTSLERPESYEGPSDIEMKIEYKGKEEKEELKYEGRIGERTLSNEEAKEVISEAFLFVENHMLREGESQTRVRTGIDIPERLTESPVEISWEAERAEVFLENGDIDFEVLKEEVDVSIFVKIRYGELEETKEYVLKLIPKELPAEEVFRKALKESVDKELESNEKAEVILPESVGEITLHYVKPKEEWSPKVVGGGFLALFFSYFLFRNRNQEEKKKREEELKESYAYFVGRFVLFLGAGLTILSIWKKLNQDETFPESLREEIKLTLWEISNGKTEREAYENFGKRIGGMKYAKFVLILTENLRQGSSQIVSRLELEAREAMLERKNNIKTIGETMGTKLLMPMMLELVLIMLIIMVPALIST